MSDDIKSELLNEVLVRAGVVQQDQAGNVIYHAYRNWLVEVIREVGAFVTKNSISALPLDGELKTAFDDLAAGLAATANTPQ
ncbi:hypothetical protein [Azospirillum argentinense]|uniref:Uncharacterized protein n=1 Tax=Azospirillum argentinense TaxID=2970906 RepID=A0A5B0KNR0_9PROT|nr:hypothetical protein [Azospirillum argentinense]KAA1053180.1 hypothetical protein FH063_003099 [Azospirillum argentinense]